MRPAIARSLSVMPPGGVGDEPERDRRPADVDVGMVVCLVGGVRDRVDETDTVGEPGS
jgi:hypothetical protein